MVENCPQNIPCFISVLNLTKCVFFALLFAMVSKLMWKWQIPFLVVIAGNHKLSGLWQVWQNEICTIEAERQSRKEAVAQTISIIDTSGYTALRVLSLSWGTFATNQHFFLSHDSVRLDLLPVISREKNHPRREIPTATNGGPWLPGFLIDYLEKRSKCDLAWHCIEHVQRIGHNFHPLSFYKRLENLIIFEYQIVVALS